jgi:hypothetical protein
MSSLDPMRTKPRAALRPTSMLQRQGASGQHRELLQRKSLSEDGVVEARAAGRSGESNVAGIVAKQTIAHDFSQVPVRHENAAGDVHRLAHDGFAASAGPLPYLSAIQRSFGPGHDLADVKAHVGTEGAIAAQRMGADAYASGSRIVFGGFPSLRTAAHEATHVVQQQSGVQFPGGVGTAGDRHEQHADAVAERVVQGRSSEDLLTQYTGKPNHPDDRGNRAHPVQMSPQSTHYGRFLDTTYALATDGADILVEFEPNDEVDAKKIGMVQSVKAVGAGKPVLTDPTQESRYVSSGPGAGHRIDRITSRNNPIYGADSLTSGQGLADTKLSNAPTGTAPTKTNSMYEIGHHFNDGGTPKHKNAWLRDTPTSEAPSNSGMSFETTALALEGAQQGTYYGSVKWGWERDASGTLKLLTFEAASQGAPTQNFLAPAAAWNTATARGTLVARNDPTQVDKRQRGSFVADYTIAKGTKVTASGMIGALGEDRQDAVVVDLEAGLFELRDRLPLEPEAESREQEAAACDQLLRDPMNRAGG